MTNEEKIKSLSTRDMALWLWRLAGTGYCSICGRKGGSSCYRADCIKSIEDWLEMEAQDDD